MNILFSAESYPSKNNPVTAFIQVLCREFVRQGHNVTVIAPQALLLIMKHPKLRRPTHFKDEWVENGKQFSIDVYSPVSISSGFGRLAKLTLWSNAVAVNLLANHLKKPDICYAHMWTSAYYISKFSAKHNIPLFVASGEDKIRVHNYLGNSELSKLKNTVYGLIAVSTKNLEESRQCGLIENNSTVVLPNAIDNKLFKNFDNIKRNGLREKLKLTPKDFVVCFVGRFYRRKGIDKLVDAIDLLKDQDVKSIFIGTSNPGEDIDPSCQGIVFKGKVPHENLPEYLNVADVFILPSFAEGCSNAIIEAMACGKPIISSNASFNYDILDNTNSILINPENPYEIANAIRILKNDKFLRDILSKGSLSKTKDLTIDNRAKKILSFINNNLKK